MTKATDTGRRSGIVRPIAIVISGIVLMWLSLAVTLAMSASASSPAVVLSLWPSAAMAKTAASWNLVNGTPTLRDQEAAAAMAGSALSREPVLADAASTLGAIFDLRGQIARADIAFGVAERLSRRELRAQLWFIERAVQRGDIDGALRHYDIALRIKPSSAALLLPVLVQASDDPLIRRPLMVRLRSKPDWRLSYLRAMLTTPPGPAAIADQIAHTGLDPASDADRRILSDGLDHLVRMGQYHLAAATLPRTRLTGPTTIRNGGFEDAPALLPFDWWLNTETDLSAYREPSRLGDGGYVLRISSENRGGQVARQLTVLSPGQYTINGIAGTNPDTGGAMPVLTVICADTQKTLATKTPTTTLRTPFALAFVVPPIGCVAQWIGIDTSPGSSVSAWMDALRLQSTAIR